MTLSGRAPLRQLGRRRQSQPLPAAPPAPDDVPVAIASVQRITRLLGIAPLGRPAGVPAHQTPPADWDR
jgi:hypothetical protein